MAILIADLSGYTALTEAHGALAAADLVDRFLEMVEGCLVGQSHLHERRGDEVMIISPSPHQLLDTALILLQKAHAEENFLLLHGGLHYGPLLQRHNHYFGTTINLASRIAGKALPGSIWCSDQFVKSLSGAGHGSFESKGKHGFKNLSEEGELFELLWGAGQELYIDPVCRMLILDIGKAIAFPSSPGTYFCSEACARIFTAKVTPG